MPGEPPDFIARQSVLPHRPKLSDACCLRRIQAQRGHILNVLRQSERSTLQHQDAVAMGLILVKEMLGQRGPERAAAQNDDVEGARVGAHIGIGCP